MYLLLKIASIALLLLTVLGLRPTEASSLLPTGHEVAGVQLDGNTSGYTLSNNPQGNSIQTSSVQTDDAGKVTSFMLGNSLFTWDSFRNGYRAEFAPTGTDLITFTPKTGGGYNYTWKVHNNGGTVGGTATAT